MAISTYSELQTAVANWLNREDLTARIPEFIALSEAQMQHDVRHWRMVQRSSLIANDRYIAVPSDWHETIRLTIDGQYQDLELMSAREMADRRWRVGSAVGQPRFYRHADQSFELFPTPDSDYTLLLEYIERIPALSDSNTTNWLLTYSPDAYLYGSMMHASTYLADDSRIPAFAQMYAAAIQRLNQSSKKSQSSGSNPKIRVRGLGGGGHTGV